MSIRPTIFTVTAIWDADAKLWSGSCDAVPAAAEEATLDELFERIDSMTSDLLAENHPGIDPGSVFFQLTALREMASPAAAA